MPAPAGGLLDNFNRANGALGANWGGVVDSTSVTAEILSNAAGCSGAGSFGEGYWNTSFAADQDVSATITVIPSVTDVVYLWARVASPGVGGAFTGYYVEAKGNGAWALYQVVSGSYTGIATVTQAIAAGDAFGLVCQGTAIEAWYKAAGGSWARVMNVTNSAITAAGYAGLGIQSTLARLDDFSGGAIAGGTPGNTRPMLVVSAAFPYYLEV